MQFLFASNYVLMRVNFVVQGWLQWFQHVLHASMKFKLYINNKLGLTYCFECQIIVSNKTLPSGYVQFLILAERFYFYLSLDLSTPLSSFKNERRWIKILTSIYWISCCLAIRVILISRKLRRQARLNKILSNKEERSEDHI